MTPRRQWLHLFTSLTAVALTAGTFVALAATDAAAQKRGGIIRVGMQGEPPTLDPHWTTAVNTEVIGGHIFEGLFTLDDSNQPIPMLAESHTVSRDGLVYTFKLRQGVPFHNGKELVADDVVASLGRWGKQSIYGKDLFSQVTLLKALDKYTVELTLKERTPVVLMNLAQPSSFAAIYPKEIAEKFPPATKVTEFIGTGPYRFVEWKPDQHVRVARFDGYKPRAEKANGYGGAKQAYADEIRWVPVPDVASRVAQMETGELDYADDLSADAYERLLASPTARPVIGKLYLWIIMVLNKKEGIMTNQKVRQAMQAALDMESVMKVAAGGRSEFYRLGSSLAPPEVVAWHTNLPGLPYNIKDKARAKALLQEAGYKGEPIRVLTSQEYKWMYDTAIVTKQQLEEIGMNVEVIVVDYATLIQRRNNPTTWDALTTGQGPAFDPTMLPSLNCNWPGWTCDEEIQKVKSEMLREVDPKKRTALWERQTRLYYEKVAGIRYADIFVLRAAAKSLKGLNERQQFARFYNVWTEK